MNVQQINKLITTYRKYDKVRFEYIMSIAQTQGIATKQFDTYGATGALPNNPKWISESKANKTKVDKFYNRITSELGKSYTAYEKSRKESYKRYKENANRIGVKPLSYKSYKDFSTNRNILIQYVYEVVYEIDHKLGADSEKSQDMISTANEIVAYVRGNDDEHLAMEKLQKLVEDLTSQAKRYGVKVGDIPKL